MVLFVHFVGIFFVGTAFIAAPSFYFLENSSLGGFSAVLTTLAFQLLVGLSMIYGAKLKKIGSEFADKVYPSSIAAALLYLAYAYRWLSAAP